MLQLGRTGGGLVLHHPAFGLRHPERRWQPSVYEVAHRRLRATGG